MEQPCLVREILLFQPVKVIEFSFFLTHGIEHGSGHTFNGRTELYRSFSDQSSILTSQMTPRVGTDNYPRPAIENKSIAPAIEANNLSGQTVVLHPRSSL